MLAVENLGKRFGSRWLFRGLEFKLGSGDVLAVCGSNGSGKSTLIKVVAGLLSPTQGTIAMPPGEPRNLIGLCALDTFLYPHLNASEHIELFRQLRNVTPSLDLLDQVGLGGVTTLVGQYSSGMRARLKLALAIQANPPILLLDEPTASLDQIGRDLVGSIVAQQRERGVCLIATNDPEDVRLCTLRIDVGSAA